FFCKKSPCPLPDNANYGKAPNRIATNRKATDGMTPIYRAYLYNQSASYRLKLLWFGFLACGGSDFVDTFLAGFGSLGGDDPVEHHFSDGFAEAKDVFFRAFVFFEGLLQVVGDDEFFDLIEDGPRSVLFGDFDALISGGGHETGFD